jgi:glucose/arabinose dehydrogenase
MLVVYALRRWARIAGLLSFMASMILGFNVTAPPVAAQRAPTTIRWPTPRLEFKLDGLQEPTTITAPNDGTNRLFIAERTGKIRIVQNGVLLSQAFLDIGGFLQCSSSESGLMGLAFPPDYAQTGYFYVHHTHDDDSNCDISIARYHVSADPNVADPLSREVILSIDKTTYFHSGGQLAFDGVNGYLHIGIGDDDVNGGPRDYAQDPNRLTGKILRLGVVSQAGTGYFIPPTNPYTVTSGSPLVWAIGLRNPFRFSFDRATNDLYLADVGDLMYEEIDFRAAADFNSSNNNFGWPRWEGDHCVRDCGLSNLVMPVITYPHHTDNCTAGIGGAVYRGPKFAKMRGFYFFSEFCKGWIGAVIYNGANWQLNWVIDAPFMISTMGEDAAGNLYVSDFNAGALYEVVDDYVVYLPSTTN